MAGHTGRPGRSGGARRGRRRTSSELRTGRRPGAGGLRSVEHVIVGIEVVVEVASRLGHRRHRPRQQRAATLLHLGQWQQIADEVDYHVHRALLVVDAHSTVAELGDDEVRCDQTGQRVVGRGGRAELTGRPHGEVALQRRVLVDRHVEEHRGCAVGDRPSSAAEREVESGAPGQPSRRRDADRAERRRPRVEHPQRGHGDEDPWWKGGRIGRQRADRRHLVEDAGADAGHGDGGKRAHRDHGRRRDTSEHSGARESVRRHHKPFVTTGTGPPRTPIDALGQFL